MSLIKQLIPAARKFTPASTDVNWTRINTLVHGPGASQQDFGDETNSALFSCLMALASSYPEPPLTVYRKMGSGKSEKLVDSPMQALLDRPTPNGELSMEEMRFWKAWAESVDGNAYWLKVRSGDMLTGNVVQMWPISPTLMRPITRKGSGDWISYYEYQIEPGKIEAVPVENVVHFRRGLDDRDMRKGLAPLKALMRQISTDEEADKFVDQLLRNYAVPGLVVIPGPGVTMDQDDADDLTERLRRKFGGGNRGNVAVMSKQSTVSQFGFSPEQLNLSVLHRIPEERISAVIGVPAIVAGLGAGLDRATYANFKEAREMFTEQKLVPMWRADGVKLTNSLRADFTNDRRVYIGHDLTDVRAFQEDEDQKYTRLQTAVGKPWITRNEARTDTGLEPVEGWDKEDIAAALPPAPAALPMGEQLNDAIQPAKADMDRYEKKAINALKKTGSAVCEFTNSLIPEDVVVGILEGLSDCHTEEEIKQLFERFQNAAIDPYLEEMRRMILALERLAG